MSFDDFVIWYLFASNVVKWLIIWALANVLKK